jgi:NADH-quinone oxidoreductase subunit K
MMSVTHYLLLSLALFSVGCIGVAMRRNILIVLMSIELIFDAVSINLVLFSRMFGDVAGQTFALFLIVVAIAEALVGLAIIIAFVRKHGTILTSEMDTLKW